MQLRKKLSTKQFILSQLLILIVSLSFLAGLYYIVNIQYQKPPKVFENGPVTALPKTLQLDLDQPDDNSLTFQSSIVVSGQTAPKLNVLISTDINDTIIQSKPDGSFSTVLDLDEGVNQITVVVFDPTGDSKSIKRTVYYSKEKL